MKLIQFFILGLSISFSYCFLICGPVIYSFLIASDTKIKRIIVKALILCIVFIIVYAVLGLMAAITGKTIIKLFQNRSGIIFIIAKIYIIIMAILLFSGKGISKRCLNFTPGSKINIVIFGILMGIVPCQPSSGAIIYIAF